MKKKNKCRVVFFIFFCLFCNTLFRMTGREIQSVKAADMQGENYYCHHLFYDYKHLNPVSGSGITIYANGTTFKAGESNQSSKQFIFYTDIYASYHYAEKNGKIKTSTGKVIIGITTSQIKPTVTNNKIIDNSTTDIAKATIKSGQITVTAVGKKGGTVYLWVIDTGHRGTYECLPIHVKIAPKKLEVQNPNGATITNLDILSGASITIQLSGISGTLRADDCTYTATVDNHSTSYIDVTPIENSRSWFTVVGKGLKNSKNTKAFIIFTCQENGKTLKFSVTVRKQ